MRIAFFTPLSPLQTAIADHSEGLIPHLANLADVDLVINTGYEPSNPEIASRFDIYGFPDFPARADEYDAILYAMGDNATFHGYIYDTLQKFPGVVILHDTTLHRTMINLSFHQDKPEMYFREMQYAYGIADSRIAQQIISGHGEEYVRCYPFFERVVDSSLRVIVHNNYARRQVLRYCPHARVTQINQHFFLPPGFPGQTDLAALRARWGLEDRFVVGSFGIFVPDKRMETCLRAFAHFREEHPEAIYLLVGSHPSGFDLPGLIRELGLDDYVVLTGWLDPVRFTEHMYLADIGIHLRYPHIGGTPFTPIRLMGLGVPTIVSDIGPLAGLPEGTCAKIPPDEFEEETLFASLTYLADHEDVRHQLGSNGARWIRTNHNASEIGARYITTVKNAVSEAPSAPPMDHEAEHRRAYLVREMAALAHSMGIRENDDALLRSLSRAILQRVET